MNVGTAAGRSHSPLGLHTCSLRPCQEHCAVATSQPRCSLPWHDRRDRPWQCPQDVPTGRVVPTVQMSSNKLRFKSTDVWIGYPMLWYPNHSNPNIIKFGRKRQRWEVGGRQGAGALCSSSVRSGSGRRYSPPPWLYRRRASQLPRPVHRRAGNRTHPPLCA